MDDQKMRLLIYDMFQEPWDPNRHFGVNENDPRTWKMGEIYERFADQPTSFVEQQVKQMCENLNGLTGQNAVYKLKD